MTRLGGVITVESDPETGIGSGRPGATFRLRLPRLDAAVGPTTATQARGFQDRQEWRSED